MPNIKVLVVGGGGGGGGFGGGGAGGYRYDATHAVSAGSFSVTVGNGGTGRSGRGDTGGASVFDTITSDGGGGGGGLSDSATGAGASGASGGGGGCDASAPYNGRSGGAGTSPEGTAGGAGVTGQTAAGGGGGSAGVGADGSGNNGGGGGAGTSNSISGSAVTYASGGGGAGLDTAGSGGTGAGTGQQFGGAAATAGTANRGGGGGGGYNATGGSGGSGVVIIRYLTSDFSGYVVTGGTITTSGSDTIHTFTSSGTWSFVVPSPTRQNDWPLPGRKPWTPTRFGATQSVNLPIYFYVPPPPFSQQHWPLPVRRRDHPAWAKSFTRSINLPLETDYNYALPWISVNGVEYATGSVSSGSIDFTSMTIVDALNEAPNTCTFIARDFVPIVGQTVSVRLGSATLANPEALFVGQITTLAASYVGTPANNRYTVNCIDWTWALGKRIVTKRYTSATPAEIAADLIATYAPGFTASHVASLDTIDEISFTAQTLPSCLTQLAKRASSGGGTPGGHWYVDYNKDLHLFITESVVSPVDVNASNTTLSAVSITQDLTQWITRAYSEGGGGSVLTDVAAGETLIPVDSADVWYSSFGGQIALPANRCTYTGVVSASSGGSLVGPGAAPSLRPSVNPRAGTGVDLGTHLYGYTYVTPSGESLISPTISRTVVAQTPDPPYPTTTLTAGAPTAGGNVTSGYDHDYLVTFVTSTGETKGGRESNSVYASPGFGTITVTGIPLGDATVTSRRLWRRYTGSDFLLVASIADNTTTTYVDTKANGDLGTSIPTVNTTTASTVTVGVPVGASSVTQRKIYRSVAGGSTMKLLATIADNTTTTYADSTADASLGATPPASDTSGLTQPSGQVLVGSTTLLAASATWARSGGGWAVIGNGQQVIRYTGVSGSTLTGIPASGPGSITATIGYNSTVTGAAMLLGIPASGDGSITNTIAKGEQANILVRVDDSVGQAALAALVGGDGVQENYQQDGRIAYDECVNRATARLAQANRIGYQMTYSVRDRNTRSGATVNVDVTDPSPLTARLMITHVEISQFSNNKDLYPTFQATAISTPLSFT